MEDIQNCGRIPSVLWGVTTSVEIDRNYERYDQEVGSLNPSYSKGRGLKPTFGLVT